MAGKMAAPVVGNVQAQQILRPVESASVAPSWAQLAKEAARPKGRSEWEGGGYHAEPGVKYLGSLGNTLKIDNSAIATAYQTRTGR